MKRGSTRCAKTPGLLETCGRFVPLFSFVILLACLNGQGQAPSHSDVLLLAATTTEDTDQSFPATLYAIGSNHKLVLLRTVVEGKDGVLFVQDSPDALFLASPHQIPTKVTVLHKSSPLQEDIRPVNDKLEVATDAETSQDASGSKLLMPLGQGPVEEHKLELISISAASGSKAGHNEWSDYKDLVYYGHPGGPSLQGDLYPSVRGNKLALTMGTFAIPFIPFVTLPPDLLKRFRGRDPMLVAASQEFVILFALHIYADIRSAELASIKEETAYIVDRKSGSWRQFAINGSCSSSRLFPDYLATIVGSLNSTHRVSPGTEDERTSPTDGRPDVRAYYRMFAGATCYMPGQLEIVNLRDLTRITIMTNKQDSEVLLVDRGVVYYRVNDRIFKAQIQGHELGPAEMIVRDADVPEIHWALPAKTGESGAN